ncbi:MAG: hypothetical protein MUC60_19000 [Oscillatoria sp. Prado101]|jgi:hypothetical protein|nr:hypothetical protein [Oscillatoria sp. Prado101]
MATGWDCRWPWGAESTVPIFPVPVTGTGDGMLFGCRWAALFGCQTEDWPDREFGVPLVAGHKVGDSLL